MYHYCFLGFLLVGVYGTDEMMRFPAMCKAPGYDEFGFEPPCEGKEEEVDGVCCTIPCPAPTYEGYGTKSSDGKCKYDFEEIVENEHLGSVCCEVVPKCPEEKGFKGHGSYRYGDEECDNYSILQDNGVCCYPLCPEPRYYKYSANSMGATEEQCAGYYHSEMVTHPDSGTTMCCTISSECPTDKYLRLGELPAPDGTCPEPFIMELVEGVCCIPRPPMFPPPGSELPPGVIAAGEGPDMGGPGEPPAPPIGGPPPKPEQKEHLPPGVYRPGEGPVQPSKPEPKEHLPPGVHRPGEGPVKMGKGPEVVV
jgi:hypothetical protein